MIPTAEIIRFYYAPSTRLAQALFWGEYSEMFNAERPGSVRGVLSNEHPYRDSPTLINPSANAQKGDIYPVPAPPCRMRTAIVGGAGESDGEDSLLERITVAAEEGEKTFWQCNLWRYNKALLLPNIPSFASMCHHP
jgi:hypothetical protein